MKPNTAVIYNSTGAIEMIVHPDTEAQLDDPAFNPKGCLQVRVARVDYDSCKSDLDVMNVTLPLITDPQFSLAIQQQVNQIELSLQPIIAVGPVDPTL